MKMDESTITTKAKDPHARNFVYQFPSNGSIKRLTVPLNLPYTRDAREQALRLIKLHRMPFHLEDELCGKLQQFAKEASDECLDLHAEESLPSDSVFDKVGVCIYDRYESLYMYMCMCTCTKCFHVCVYACVSVSMCTCV